MGKIDDLYKELLKRDPTAEEKRSEEENAQRYGQAWLDKQLKENLEIRAAPTMHRAYESQESGRYPDIGGDPRTEEGYGTEYRPPPPLPPIPPVSTSTGSRTDTPTPTTLSPSLASLLGGSQQSPPFPPELLSSLSERNRMLSALNESEQTRFNQLQAAEQVRIAEVKAAEEARQKELARREAENVARRDALYAQLLLRSQQSLSVDPSDPIIRAQVDPYRAEQERARRNLVSDAAETGRPLGPTQAAMAAERTSQNVGSLQAELMARTLASRREGIAEALDSMTGILTADQQASLQRELAQLDNVIRQQQLGLSARELNIRESLGLGDIGLRRELGLGDLGLRGELGRGQLAIGERGLDIEALRDQLANRQFFADLALRQKLGLENLDISKRGMTLQEILGHGGLDLDRNRRLDQIDQFLRRLGFDTADRARYWDWMERNPPK